MAENILIVDDEERIRKLLNMYLVREGYEITEADNGEDALEYAMEKDFHCILLDLMMPKMDGIEVAKRLRNHKSTPIIMLTVKRTTGWKALKSGQTITSSNLSLRGKSF